MSGKTTFLGDTRNFIYCVLVNLDENLLPNPFGFGKELPNSIRFANYDNLVNVSSSLAELSRIQIVCIDRHEVGEEIPFFSFWLGNSFKGTNTGRSDSLWFGGFD